MTPFERKVGRRIADQRRLTGLSQARLAEKVGVAVETISRLETGAAVPSISRLASIADALKLELHELVRLRPRDRPEDRAMERLVWLMSRRTAREIDLMTSLAAAILDHMKIVDD
jgi:transcriptional regulator with XRE-family HTH domain